MSGLVGYLMDRIAILQSVGAEKVSECLRRDCIRVFVEYLIDPGRRKLRTLSTGK